MPPFAGSNPAAPASALMLLTVGPLVMLALGMLAISIYAIDAPMHARPVRILRRRHPGEMP